MSMSLRHFFKRLPYTTSHCLTHPPPYAFPLPLPLLLTLSSTNQSTPTSLFTNFSMSSSLHPPSTNSFTPSYFSVRIRCQKQLIDVLSEALLSFGASSTSVDEQDGCESSDETFIDSIFPECEDVDTCISQAADSIGLKEIPSYEVKTGDQCDWIKKTQVHLLSLASLGHNHKIGDKSVEINCKEANLILHNHSIPCLLGFLREYNESTNNKKLLIWPLKESFHPVKVTEGLWIVPEWRAAPDAKATNIILNPGLAFGTGEHPTTKLCLLLLQSLIKGGELFLDYGTGSGILAIAAVKFGAALSVGIDIDSQAITSASHNAVLNNIGPEKLKLCLVPDNTCPPSKDERADHNSYQTGAISDISKYDVVIANILLNPLLELADHIISYAKPGAVVGISGILSEQLPDIINRYSQVLEGLSVSEMDDWACVRGTKKANPSGS